MSQPSEPQPRHGTMSRHARPAPRPRATVVGVLGEVLITAGVLVLLFLGWQVWWNSLILSGQQTTAAAEQSKKFLDQEKSTPDTTPDASSTTRPSAGTPPVMKAVADYQPFGVLYIPRFGDKWARVIKETVDVDQVLNSYTSGIGHYPGTAMPGAVGNFAVAGHDSGYGNAFIDVSKLQLGDPIYVQTKDGFYTYQYRNSEYVQPDAVNVLLPVPTQKSAKPTDRLITLTTCNPPFHAAERLIAYGTFESWSPTPPAAIAPLVATQNSAQGG